MRTTLKFEARLPTPPAPAAAPIAVLAEAPALAALPEAAPAAAPAPAPAATLAEKLNTAHETAKTYAATAKEQLDEVIRLHSYRGRINALLYDLRGKLDPQQRDSILATLKEHKGAFETAIDNKVKFKSCMEDYQSVVRMAARGVEAERTDPKAAQEDLDRCRVVHANTKRRHYMLLTDTRPALDELRAIEPALIRIEEALKVLRGPIKRKR